MYAQQDGSQELQALNHSAQILFRMGLLLLIGGLVSCGSSKPLVKATTYGYTFPEIDGIEKDIGGPDFEMPEMIGGIAAFGAAMNTLAESRPCPVRGRVSVAYVVNTHGIVEVAKIAEGIHEICDQVAVDAMKQMRFIPAKKNGQVIKIVMATPARFK